MMIIFLFWVFLISSATLEASGWESFLKAAIRDRLPQATRIELTQIKVAEPPQGKARLIRFTPDPPLGLFHFELETVHKGVSKRSTGSAQARVFAPIAVAHTPLQHGEGFTPANVRFEERELGPLSQAGYFLDGQGLEGRTAKGYVSVGQVIAHRTSQAKALVMQGETIDCVRERNGLRLVAKVRALQSGASGSWVQVLNPSSGKMLLAKVVKPGEVEVR